MGGKIKEGGDGSIGEKNKKRAVSNSHNDRLITDGKVTMAHRGALITERR